SCASDMLLMGHALSGQGSRLRSENVLPLSVEVNSIVSRCFPPAAASRYSTRTTPLLSTKARILQQAQAPVGSGLMSFSRAKVAPLSREAARKTPRPDSPSLLSGGPS